MDFLITQILSKWWMPHSEKQSIKSQSSLMATLISSSADFVDLLDYVNQPVIAETIGINFIFSNPIPNTYLMIAARGRLIKVFYFCIRIAVASLSMLQFSFNLMAVKDMNLKKQNVLLTLLDFVFW